MATSAHDGLVTYDEFLTVGEACQRRRARVRGH
jgi:hypothetical protein